MCFDTFSNCLDKDGIVASDDEAEATVVSVDHDYSGIVVTAITTDATAAVDGRSPLELGSTSTDAAGLESRPIRLVQPGKQQTRIM